MQIGTAGRYLLSAIIGEFVLSQIVFMVVNIILAVIFKANQSFYSWLNVLYIIIALLVLFAGIIIGIRSYKRKNLWYKIFRPNKHNIIVSLSLACTLLIIVLLLDSSFIYLYNLKQYSGLFAYIGGYISAFIMFYPFSALACFIYDSKKGKRKIPKSVVVIILVIMLNPLFILVSYSMTGVYYNQIVKQPCLQVHDFAQDSPARDAGMHKGEFIISVDGLNVNSFEDLSKFLEIYDSSENITIKTLENTYQLSPMREDNKTVLGVTLYSTYCFRYQ